MNSRGAAASTRRSAGPVTSNSPAVASVESRGGVERGAVTIGRMSTASVEEPVCLVVFEVSCVLLSPLSAVARTAPMASTITSELPASQRPRCPPASLGAAPRFL